VSLVAALIDLVLPRRCVGCGSFAGALCPQCLPPPDCLNPLAGVWAAGPYDAALRTALLAYKERGRRDLADHLGRLLACSVAAALNCGPGPPGRAVLVPVPSARSVVAARGGDHVVRLARQAAMRTGLRVVRDALDLTRAVQDSAGLRTGERVANLAGAMTARAPLTGVSAVIVDDIVTTGSTLSEARRALTAAGWAITGAAVVAATQLRHRGESLTPLAAPSNTV
jgi:predicted amidophosphoribosyltransferase